jgi:hypothetical protein
MCNYSVAQIFFEIFLFFLQLEENSNQECDVKMTTKVATHPMME